MSTALNIHIMAKKNGFKLNYLLNRFSIKQATFSKILSKEHTPSERTEENLRRLSDFLHELDELQCTFSGKAE